MVTEHISIRITIILLVLIGWVPMVQAEIAISRDMVKLIETISAKSYTVYPVDKEKKERIFDIVDQWAQTQIPLDDAYLVSDKSSERTTWVKETSQNMPILSVDPKGDKLSPKKPYRIKYVKRLKGRSFVKSLRMPSPDKLDKEQVAKIGRRFIEKNSFTSQTTLDKIGHYLVVNRVSQILDSDSKKTDKLTILQRAVFRRTLNGLEVFNSKQIVDVHPESGEILAYKHINWAPAKETDAKPVSVMQAEQVLRAIHEAFKSTSARYHVNGVGEGMYQSNDSIFPVLAVSVERVRKNQDEAPILKTLYIPLAKNQKLPERQRIRKLPRIAK